MKQNDLNILQKIAGFEAENDMSQFKIGWSWRHVKIWPTTLARLFKDGYLDNVFRSNSHTGYRLSELGRSIINDLHEETGSNTDGIKKSLEIDETIFSDIIGQDDEKELLLA
ncbi:MAG: AAA family ATPase, partial [Dehalococcoidales bacterium]|nr:AAA family ATPase [Dehalococcoidales bacterium]